MKEIPNVFAIIDARLSTIEELLIDIKYQMRVGALANNDVTTKADRKVMNIDQLCEYTGITKGTVYKYTSEKSIPHSKRGKKLIFDRDKIDEWLLENRVSSKKELDADADRQMKEFLREGFEKLDKAERKAGRKR